MYFIVFEGLDGSGKSTLISNLEKHLRGRHQDILCTREPGGTPLAEELRQLILRRGGEIPSPRTELLLYESSRAQHVENRIRPALMKGQWVLCDRFTPSSIAFQAAGRNIATEDVEWLNRFAIQDVRPHLVVLLDLTVEESRRRQSARESGSGATRDRIESEESSFHEKVRRSFLQQASEAPKKSGESPWLVLDATRSPDDLLQLLLIELRRRQWLES
jgi:dTMP kinase